MPRPYRPLAPGLTYHVTTRGNRRQPISLDDEDARRLLTELGRVALARGWVVSSYCVMPNHLHVLVTTPLPDLSEGLQTVLGRFARWFNDRHEFDGHLFQGRFHTRVVTTDSYFLELFRYLALNPVRAGLAADPERYRWSAHAALLGRVSRPLFLDLGLAPFGGDREAYREFVGAAGRSFLIDLLGDASDERLRIAAHAGFTQRDIAEALAVEQSTVCRRLARIKGVRPR